jgi:hypothetical protein
MNIFRLGLGVALATVLAAPAMASSLVNGSFEQPGGEVRDQLTTNYIPGWTYTQSASSSFDVYEADDVGDGLAAADGSHYVSFGHNGTYGGSVSQTFATVAGASYTVNYSVAEQQGDDPSQDLRAIVLNGAQTLTVDNSPLGLSFLAAAPISFTANGTSVTLEFLDATPAGGGGPSNLALDAVSVMGPDGAGVPEPAVWTMVLAGIGLAGAMIRRRTASLTA